MRKKHLRFKWNKRPIQSTLLILAGSFLLGATVGIANAQNLGGAEPADGLKVMTWNIKGGHLRRANNGQIESVPCRLNGTDNYLHNVAEEIKRHAGLDVIALQEIYRVQASTLAESLARTHGFEPIPYFVETRSCGPDGDQYNDFGIAIISRHPFLHRENVALDPCIKIGNLTIFCPIERRRLARVIIRVDGRDVNIYNTHLNPKPHFQEWEVRRLRSKIRTDRDNAQNYLPVLMGDLNADPTKRTYHSIRDERFLDAWREDEDNAGDPGVTFDTFPDNDRRPHEDKRIDYIFVGSGGVFNVLDVQVTSSNTLFDVFGLQDPKESRDFNKVPDHRPVIARLSFRLLNAERWESSRPTIASSFPFLSARRFKMNDRE